MMFRFPIVLLLILWPAFGCRAFVEPINEHVIESLEANAAAQLELTPPVVSSPPAPGWGARLEWTFTDAAGIEIRFAMESPSCHDPLTVNWDSPRMIVNPGNSECGSGEPLEAGGEEEQAVITLLAIDYVREGSLDHASWIMMNPYPCDASPRVRVLDQKAFALLWFASQPRFNSATEVIVCGLK